MEPGMWDAVRGLATVRRRLTRPQRRRGTATANEIIRNRPPSLPTLSFGRLPLVFSHSSLPHPPANVPFVRHQGEGGGDKNNAASKNFLCFLTNSFTWFLLGFVPYGLQMFALSPLRRRPKGLALQATERATHENQSVVTTFLGLPFSCSAIRSSARWKPFGAVKSRRGRAAERSPPAHTPQFATQSVVSATKRRRGIRTRFF